MEQIFQTLQGIIVRALPTVFLFVLLHWYLKKVLFQPLERVLDQRRKATEGAVAASEATVQKAEEKLRAYEQALSDARAEIYRDQENFRKDLESKQAQATEEARRRATDRLAAAKAEIATEVATAQAGLRDEADRLADLISNSVLSGRAQ
jgi:F-type H+-transporting ATPase subunit b